MTPKIISCHIACMVLCAANFFIYGFYHKRMKTGQRIVIKEYRRHKLNTGKEFPSACIRFPSSPSIMRLAL